jgi:hypothetical protein
MVARQGRWLTAQQAAAEMNTTSAEVCRLLSLGRLSGYKQKQAGRPGNGQWLIDPKSIVDEKRRSANRTRLPEKTSPRRLVEANVAAGKRERPTRTRRAPSRSG